jgi:hypothetical protein
VRVGGEPRSWVTREDAVESVERLVFFALFAGQEAVDIEREVVVLELRIVAEDAAEELPGRTQVRRRSGTAFVDGESVPALEAVDVGFPLHLPAQLAETEKRFGELGGFLGRLVDEGREEGDGVRTERPDAREVAIEAGVELGAKPSLESIGEAGTFGLR